MSNKNERLPTVYICRARCEVCGCKEIETLRSWPEPDGTRTRRTRCTNPDCLAVFLVNIDYVPFSGNTTFDRQ
ncbi:hypothetical protein Q31b_42000 [Novipirellula aureliae]|uniref:Ogr/Delta-like zinc finger n=1 Tax=Novipirellula aureliae TaxID=2527966 RepID=A0A5C6DT65_9BACT|nr:hypothetical protein Q31b_42000 [Novipirellula aureliae]